MRRHVPWVAIISQYLSYITIVYRKGEDNDADGLSRRLHLMDFTDEFINDIPSLKAKFEAYDAGIFKRDFESMHNSMAKITHLQLDPIIRNDIIIHGYMLDKAFYHIL